MANILVVEDDKALNSAYQMILEKDGHAVTTVFDGGQALEFVDTNQPDIILLDLLMPNVDGIQFLEKFETIKHPETKIIVLSNMGDEKLVKKAAELGAYKYIVKAHTTPGQLSLMVKRIAENK
jgi:DNA-binding response OmpR family regulator